jgi:predicted site-specific integrase-resolvase
MNLKEWAEQEGVAYVTARRWFASGKLPVPARKVGGLILVGDQAGTVAQAVTAVYARVSSAEEQVDLDRQVALVTAWAAGKGLPVGRVVTEVGSALDGKCVKLIALLRDKSVTTIVTEHRGRFARFGVEYVEAALAAQGRRLLVAGPWEVDEDLVPDATEVLTALCARLYRRREAADRAARALEAIIADAP